MTGMFGRSATLAPRQRVAALQASGVDVISLVGGGPGIDLPPDAKAAISRALEDGPLGTTDSRGLAGLRQRISEDFSRAHGVVLDPDRIIVTVGAKEATMVTFMSLLQPGDEVLLPDPAWVGYEPWIVRAGATPVRFPLEEREGFRPDWKVLRSLLSGKTRLLVLTNPHNPTGTVLAPDELAALGDVLDGSDVVVVSDESNCRIVFDRLDFTSTLQDPGLSPRTLLIRSFSKSFGMPGWRLGFIWAPDPYYESLLAAHEHAVSCVPAIVQLAACAVMDSEQMQRNVDRMIASLHEQRGEFVTALNRLPGVTCLPPQGAYNVFPDFSELGIPSAVLAEQVLEAGVAAVPGAAFGARGEGHLRLAFTLPAPRLRDAAERIARVCSVLAAGTVLE
jgi:aspartate/methionine/tyrosine aminotransferase